MKPTTVTIISATRYIGIPCVAAVRKLPCTGLRLEALIRQCNLCHGLCETQMTIAECCCLGQVHRNPLSSSSAEAPRQRPQARGTDQADQESMRRAQTAPFPLSHGDVQMPAAPARSQTMATNQASTQGYAFCLLCMSCPQIMAAGQNLTRGYASV